MYSQIRNTSITCIILIALVGFFQTASADTETNKAVVLRVVELWNTGDLSIADEIFAADFVSHVPHQPHVTDLESYKAQVIDDRTGKPDLHIELHDMVAEGDKVAWRLTVSATVQAIGVHYTNTCIVIDRFADGKIVEEWWEFDVYGVYQQVGVITPGRPMPENYTWGEPSAVTGDPGDPETNKAIALRQLEELCNMRNLAIADEIFSPEFVNHDPANPDVVDLESFKGLVVAMQTGFPDLHETAEDMVAEGDRVVMRRTATGTHQGELAGMSPTGRQVTMTMMVIFRFADGKIVETWWSFDMLGLMQQLTTPEWPLAGAWIATVPTPLGNIIFKGIWAAQDATNTQFTGEFEQINTYPVLIDVYPDAEEVKFAGGLAVKIGLNKYEMTSLEYFTKTAGASLEEIVGIGIVTGTIELVGPDLHQGQGTGAYYMAAQDADQDGFPDEGEEPVLCMPWGWTAKRLTSMPACVPTPIPE